MMVNQKLLIAGLIGTVVIVMSTVVFPFWNLVPHKTTEIVKIISIDQSGCVVETFDKFVIQVASCDGKPGDRVPVTFDAKIRERARSFSP